MQALEKTLTPTRVKDPLLREAQLWDQFNQENPGLFKENKTEYTNQGRKIIGKALLTEFGESIRSYLSNRGYI